jgi:hypothetical protein
MRRCKRGGTGPGRHYSKEQSATGWQGANCPLGDADTAMPKGNRAEGKGNNRNRGTYSLVLAVLVGVDVGANEVLAEPFCRAVTFISRGLRVSSVSVVS